MPQKREESGTAIAPICARVDGGGEATLTYIERLNAFYAFLKRQPLSPNARLLYYTLLQINNERGWAPWFAVTNAHLCMFIGLGEKALVRARKELVEQQLIGVQPSRTRGVATRYTLLPPPSEPTAEHVDGRQACACADGPTDRPTGPPTDAQPADLSEKRQREKKEGRAHAQADAKRAYAPHVYLTETEYAGLRQRYGEAMLSRMIDTLEAYKRTSGRAYASDAAALERWVADRCARAPAANPALAYDRRAHPAPQAVDWL